MSFVRPRPLIVLATVCFMALTIKLGLWQLHRGQAQSAQDVAQAQADRAGVAAWHGEIGPAAWEHKVTMSGEWDASNQVLLDNRIHNEQAGYYVLTPLRLDDGRVMAVMRGWVARGANGAPRVEVPAGQVHVVVRLALPDQHYVELSSSTVAGNVWQNLDWSRYRALVKKPLVAALAYQLDGNDALVRDWPQGGVSAERHYMYAGQWFLFAGLAGALFIILHWKRKPS
jgi:surfeit locus 1 family protein